MSRALYLWHMNNKMYYRVTASVFAIIALLHAARAVLGWEAIIDGAAIPIWVSYAAVLIAGYLAFRGFTAKV